MRSHIRIVKARCLAECPKDIVIVHTSFMVLEVHVSTEDDSGGLTFGVQAWDVIVFLKLFEMEFDMIPSFVHC